MRDTSLKSLVDRGATIDLQIKKLTDELAEIKDQIKMRGKELDCLEFQGSEFVAKISAQTKSIVNPKDLHSTLKNINKEESFYSFISVEVSKTKKALGDMIFESISKVEMNPYGRVTFKGL